jgi:hypothetical protein
MTTWTETELLALREIGVQWSSLDVEPDPGQHRLLTESMNRRNLKGPDR